MLAFGAGPYFQLPTFVKQRLKKYAFTTLFVQVWWFQSTTNDTAIDFCPGPRCLKLAFAVVTPVVLQHVPNSCQ